MEAHRASRSISRPQEATLPTRRFFSFRVQEKHGRAVERQIPSHAPQAPCPLLRRRRAPAQPPHHPPPRRSRRRLPAGVRNLPLPAGCRRAPGRRAAGHAAARAHPMSRSWSCPTKPWAASAGYTSATSTAPPSGSRSATAASRLSCPAWLPWKRPRSMPGCARRCRPWLPRYLLPSHPARHEQRKGRSRSEAP
ncbi:MAG: hypothetical protein JWP58_4496, partial [Hymenobacter sp.]|nr:hypothetical protein [Hymenobacter sp.]